MRDTADRFHAMTRHPRPLLHHTIHFAYYVALRQSIVLRECYLAIDHSICNYRGATHWLPRLHPNAAFTPAIVNVDIAPLLRA